MTVRCAHVQGMTLTADALDYAIMQVPAISSQTFGGNFADMSSNGQSQ